MVHRRWIWCGCWCVVLALLLGCGSGDDSSIVPSTSGNGSGDANTAEPGGDVGGNVDDGAGVTDPGPNNGNGGGDVNTSEPGGGGGGSADGGAEEPDPRSQDAEQCIAEFGLLLGSGSIEDLDTAQSAVDQCTAEGVPCDAAEFMSRESAECIALTNGLEAGITAWDSSLVYNVGFRLPIWAVRNTLFVEEDGHIGGVGMSIDAVTGEVLLNFGWGGIP